MPATRLQVVEMARRGLRDASPLDRVHATGETTQTEFVEQREVRLERLAQLGCGCVRSRTAGGGVRSGKPIADAVSRAIRAQHRK